MTNSCTTYQNKAESVLSIRFLQCADRILFIFFFISCLFLEALCMILYEKARGKYRVVKCTINDHFMHHNTQIKYKVPYL